MITPVRMIVRPYRRLKAYGGAAASAHALGEPSKVTARLGDETSLVRDLMHRAQAELCYVELVGPGAVAALPRRRKPRRQAELVDAFSLPAVNGPDGAA